MRSGCSLVPVKVVSVVAAVLRMCFCFSKKRPKLPAFSTPDEVCLRGGWGDVKGLSKRRLPSRLPGIMGRTEVSEVGARETSLGFLQQPREANSLGRRTGQRAQSGEERI